jgi:RNA polymerase sigma-70 factor (ECF subfamily)
VNVDQRRQRLEALYVQHADAVFAYARRRAEAAVAEDVVMEVFLVACRRLEDVPDPALPWLLACARRVLANQRRSAARAQSLSARLQQAGRAAGVDDRAAGLLGSALEKLGDSDREIILLSAWEGLDLSGLAFTLDCSRGAAAVRLHRARRRLRRAMEREGSATAEPQTMEVSG